MAVCAVAESREGPRCEGPFGSDAPGPTCIAAFTERGMRLSIPKHALQSSQARPTLRRSSA